MPILNISIKNKIAKLQRGAAIVCGNSDYKINFEFDTEWNDYLVKTARFVYGDNKVDVVFKNNECDVPIFTEATNLMVGVFAGNLSTSTPANICVINSIISYGGMPPAPTDDVYTQIVELFGDAELTRVESESFRVKAEDTRINTESVRVSSESQRIVAETFRCDAETHRDASMEDMKKSISDFQFNTNKQLDDASKQINNFSNSIDEFGKHIDDFNTEINKINNIISDTTNDITDINIHLNGIDKDLISLNNKATKLIYMTLNKNDWDNITLTQVVINDSILVKNCNTYSPLIPDAGSTLVNIITKNYSEFINCGIHIIFEEDGCTVFKAESIPETDITIVVKVEVTE